ncbi:hypothetical protein COV61_01820 [Candidatus Micrarchaeota archaeon CG11_big_fil_rev_8_21_14_0_20_47_5]|nr:MAG: hypothetical protein AUJ17_02220 [Candidatus Micrarchaeota archaeon CG1_02_47_40]PIN83887.1 MAG: hypothetical protein COV61_01820 [Candidatus Micrarchaeota archaeon CG11_big_fil_rev_8_21_14_0_20_47_5]
MNLQKELEKIKERNARVEADKAWETSLHRRGAVGIAIYAVALVFLYSINAENAVLSALVPAVAYFLSTLTLPFLKGMWLKNVYKK